MVQTELQDILSAPVVNDDTGTDKNKKKLPRYSKITAPRISNLSKVVKGVGRASAWLFLLDKELTQSIVSMDGYSLADMTFFGVTQGIPALVPTIGEIYKNRQELWDNRELLYRDIVELAGARLLNDARMGLNNAFGDTTYDYELARKAYQEYAISYVARINDGKLVHAEQKRYRWSFVPFSTAEQANLEYFKEKYGVEISSSLDAKKSGILRIYSPIMGRLSGLNYSQEQNKKEGYALEEGGEHLETTYIVENRRVIAQINEQPNGNIETYFYDDSPNQTTPLVRTSISGEHFAVTREARNELEALWGIVETDALKDIRIGKRTHVRRFSPRSFPLENPFYFDEETDDFIMSEIEGAEIETEYFYGEHLSSSSYETVLQARQHFWRISQEKLDEYLKQIGMTRAEFESYVCENKKIPNGLVRKMTYTSGDDEYFVHSTGCRLYRNLEAVIFPSERKDIPDDLRRLNAKELKKRNTPDYAVLSNPYLKREYASFCSLDINYKNGMQTRYDADGNVIQEQLFDVKGENNTREQQSIVSLREYVYQKEKGKKKLKCILYYDSNGMLIAIQDAVSQKVYNSEFIKKDANGNVFIVLSETEQVDLTEYLVDKSIAINETMQDKWQRKNHVGIHQSMPFMSELFTYPMDTTPIKGSSQLIRVKEKTQTQQTGQFQLYWSDGYPIGGITVDKKTGACGIYNEKGELICVDVPSNNAEIRGIDWLNNQHSERFQRIAKIILKEQYQNLKQNPEKFHDIMAQWFLLSDEEIASSHDPQISRLAIRTFFDQYKQDYPEYLVSLFSVEDGVDLNINFDDNIAESIEQVTQDSHNRMYRMNFKREGASTSKVDVSKRLDLYCDNGKEKKEDGATISMSKKKDKQL